LKPYMIFAFFNKIGFFEALFMMLLRLLLFCIVAYKDNRRLLI